MIIKTLEKKEIVLNGTVKLCKYEINNKYHNIKSKNYTFQNQALEYLPIQICIYILYYIQIVFIILKCSWLFNN